MEPANSSSSGDESYQDDSSSSSDDMSTSHDSEEWEAGDSVPPNNSGGEDMHENEHHVMPSDDGGTQKNLTVAPPPEHHTNSDSTPIAETRIDTGPGKKQRQRVCGLCKRQGHNRRTCPEVGKNQDKEKDRSSQPNKKQKTTDIDDNKLIFIVFDLETTGFSRDQDYIIEVGGLAVSKDGHVYDQRFDELVKPGKPIPQHITTLTGITNEMVHDADDFSVVGRKFLEYIDGSAMRQGEDMEIVLVAHNGKNFDIPFLLNAFKKSDINMTISIKYFIDTLEVVKDVYSNNRSRSGGSAPPNYKLATLYEHFTGEEMGSNAHRASFDVDAAAIVLTHKLCWENYARHIRLISFAMRAVTKTGDDSDEEADDIEDETLIVHLSNADGTRREPIEVHQSLERTSKRKKRKGKEKPLPTEWQKNTVFKGIDSKTLFDNYHRSRLTRSNASESHSWSGIQGSRASFNSVTKCWRSIFTDSILNMIVDRTNEYGNNKCKRWGDIDKEDIIDFFCILFIAGIQKRRDTPSHWFSNDPLLQSAVIKRIMPGRKFSSLLRNLHVCPLERPISDDAREFNPMYKVHDLLEKLESRFEKLFVPGQALSLDETLIRAFGRIKFKVRIVTKAARYGIKLYVITDAVTAYVLRVIPYTGKSTYYISADTEADMKKTCQIVKSLCEKYKGSHRTVYVDRFYTSLDVMKELYKMGLYVTGTLMKNRIPSQFTLTKTMQKYKTMSRGDHTKHLYEYKEGDDVIQFGLVLWKDRDVVYVLSSECNNTDTDSCKRRTKDGIITISRPKVISKYNQYMGGVDLADMRRLHCQSNVMGLHRWWLRIFFYLLDIGTSNSMVLFNEALQDKKDKLNLVEFKHRLVHRLLGTRITDVPRGPAIHQIVRIGGESGSARQRCAYCAIVRQGIFRTRYMCSICKIPLCTPSSGKVDRDCFSEAHKSDDIRCLVKSRHMLHLSTTNKRYKNLLPQGS